MPHERPDSANSLWFPYIDGIRAPLTAGFDEVANQCLAFEMPIENEMEFTGPVVARIGLVAADGSYKMLRWA